MLNESFLFVVIFLLGLLFEQLRETMATLLFAFDLPLSARKSVGESFLNCLTLEDCILCLSEYQL